MASEKWLHKVHHELSAMAARQGWNFRQSSELVPGQRAFEFWSSTRVSRAVVSSEGFDINGKLVPFDPAGWFDVDAIQKMIAEGVIERRKDVREKR